MNNNYQLTSSSETYSNFIIFNLNEKEYAINLQNVIEVINIPKIEIPEQLPKGIIGIFNYNGIMIKILDLSPLLGFETTEFSITNQLIITSFDNQCVALRVDSIDNIAQFENNNIQEVPFNSDTSILGNIYKDGKSIINIIDISKVNKIIAQNSSQLGTVDYKKLFPTDEKSLQILELRAEQSLRHQDMFTFPLNINTNNQYILFTLDNQNYFLDLKHVKEFTSIKRLNITTLPYTKDYIKGIINLKGDFLIVIDLKRFLNNETSQLAEGSKLIVVSGKNFNIALLVDDIKNIKNLTNNQIRNPEYTGSSEYISNEFVEDGQLYNILNFDKFINDDKLYINI